LQVGRAGIVVEPATQTTQTRSCLVPAEGEVGSGGIAAKIINLRVVGSGFTSEDNIG
jgi:hypothetical protein